MSSDEIKNPEPKRKGILFLQPLPNQPKPPAPPQPLKFKFPDDVLDQKRELYNTDRPTLHDLDRIKDVLSKARIANMSTHSNRGKRNADRRFQSLKHLQAVEAEIVDLGMKPHEFIAICRSKLEKMHEEFVRIEF